MVLSKAKRKPGSQILADHRTGSVFLEISTGGRFPQHVQWKTARLIWTHGIIALVVDLGREPKA
jgi:hypothetical protein